MSGVRLLNRIGIPQCTGPPNATEYTLLRAPEYAATQGAFRRTPGGFPQPQFAVRHDDSGQFRTATESAIWDRLVTFRGATLVLPGAAFAAHD